MKPSLRTRQRTGTLMCVTGPHETGLPLAMRTLLDRGGLILTANARAARALDRRYAEDRQAEHAVAWPTPHILDLHSWLTEQWQLLLLTGTEDRLLLNDVQEHALWQNITKPLLEGRSLIEPARMAILAQQAYVLLANYGALGRLNDAMWMAESAEPEIFRRWARSFEQDCAQRRCLPRCELMGAITHALRWGALAPPSEIGWLGFDRATPAEDELRSALDARGAKQQSLSWQIEHTQPPRLHTAASDREETAACAAWVGVRLSAQPDARIGILMPDLASRRAPLERDLFRLLSPQRFPITAGAAPPLPFEFSLGQPLAQVPLVHSALLLLRWLHKPLTQQEISWLLLSSTLRAGQGAGERDSLAQWDARLRRETCAPPEMTLETMLGQQSTGSGAVSPLVEDLTAMLQAHRRASRPAAAGEWVQRIGERLRLARWGEHADASSLLFQARDAWDRLLDNVASLDFSSRAFPYREFLKTLERTAHETIFSPESEDAPIQVMGAFAAAGQSFDAVWFLGATDTAWPAAGRPHSLLPVALQREFAMPHTSAAEDRALAHRTMERVIESSGEIVFSWAQQAAESLQRPSSLVTDFAEATFAITDEQPRTLQLEHIADDSWVPFTQTGVAPGGQAPLKRQADCPFQAFVVQRLGVRELPVAGRGLSPMERGTLLHKVLQHVWSSDTAAHRHLTSHADLVAAIASGTLQPLVAAHAHASIRRMGAERGEPWQRAYLDAEQSRVTDLAMDWLEHESTRQPFEVILVEEKISVQVGDLALSVRADRIDAVADGQLLIDYKTGEVSTASWDGARPEQPQLPLYAAFGNAENLVGALFAQVRKPKLGFKGRVANPQVNLSNTIEDDDKQIAPYTQEVVEEWRGVLTQLAGSFLRGEAQVDPHVYPKTCQFCPLPGVCRTAESQELGLVQISTDDEDSE